MVLAAALPACGSDPEGGGGNTGPKPDAGAGTWAGECIRVAELMTPNRVCGRDDDCPCGMACALGRCESRCTENAQCAQGTVCDSFGRCASPDRANKPVGPGDTTVTPAPAPNRNAADGGQPADAGAGEIGQKSQALGVDGGAAPAVPLEGGVVALSRSALDLLSAESVGSFELVATGSDVEQVRIQADPGVQLDCSASGVFVSECYVSPLRVAAVPTTIRLRAEGAFPTADERVQVSVFAGGVKYEVGVTKRGGPRNADIPREGEYEGTAWLVGAGLRARTVEDTLPDEVARLRLTVRAKVHPQNNGRYTVSFEESRRAVFPAGAVGTLSVTSGSSLWQLNVPSRQYLGEDVDAPSNALLDVHAAETMTDATFSNGVLQGDVVTSFEGVTTAQYAPFVRWRLSMSRVGALADGAAVPAVTTRAVADVAARANAAFAEESGLNSLAGFAALTVPAQENQRAMAAWCTPVGSSVIALTSTTDQRGDLNCAGGSSQRAFATTLGTLVDRGDYLDDCLRAFDPTNTELGDAAPCTNRARAFSTMALALGPDRARALGTRTEPNPALSRLGSRALQLWLGAQSIAGSDPTRLAVLGPILPGGTDMEKLRFYAQYDNVFAALKASVSAWDLVLHPRIGTGLAAMPPQALENPDYRPDFAPGSYGSGEQKVGVPVNMLAALTSQLSGVTGLVDALANQRIDTSAANRYAVEVANFMPRSIVVFAMAQGLRDAARSNGNQPWENSWIAVRAKYGAALATLSSNLRSLESQENPLGISEGDLPLYRLGEQTGANSRFSAVSDSLLGREDSLDPAIAPVLVDRAREAETMARESISRVLARDYESELQTAATDRNLLQIKRYYGEQITSLCPFHLEVLTVLDQPELVDMDTCHIKPECLARAPQVAGSDTDNAHTICRFAKARRVLGDAMTTGSGSVDAAIDALEPQFVATAALPLIPQSLRDGLVALRGTNQAELRLPATISPELKAGLQDCDGAKDRSLATRPTASPASCATTDECPASMVCDRGSSTCTLPQDFDASCFQGAMGGHMLGLSAAATDLEIARAEFNEYADAYANAMDSCNIMATANATAAGYYDDFNQTMKRLEGAKAAADIAEKALGVTREILSTTKSDFADLACKPLAIAAGVGEVVAFTVSASLGAEMENLERSHTAMLDKLDRQTDHSICLNEAKSHLIGQKAAALRITRQEQEVQSALLDIYTTRGDLGAAVADGLASLEFERARAVLPSNADYWLDSNIDLFQQRLRRARRALYLAILGVEYEFQQTSAERANVLAAQSSADLEAILGRVRDGVRRGAPSGGGNPTELRSVISMRDNVLRLADHSNLGPGWHNLTDVQRFQVLLVSPQYATYANGEYLGQEIPFSLAPGGTSLTEASSIPLFSGLSCAERLWSVNAVVAGQNLMQGTDTSLTTLQVRKRNTFQSQWCSGSQRTTAQVSSTRPGVNLFIDPLSASSWTEDGALAALTSVSQTNAFSFATVQARLNVARADMESDEYTNGGSNALAGRGAFGEYTLFIPRTSLSVNGGAGLALQNVEDILIRLDYVAAERQ